MSLLGDPTQRRFALVLFPAIFFWAWFAWMLTASEKFGFWASGDTVSGDLIQHYAAGRFWNEERTGDLYQGYAVGQWITDYHQAIKADSSYQVVQFNYVYSPLIAWVSGLVSHWPFVVWTASWLVLMLFFYGCALWLLNVGGSLEKRLSFIDVLACLGFPALFYTMVPLQNTTMTLAIATGSALLWNRNMPLLAGLILSCASYKPQLMPLLVLFFVCLGFWRMATGLILGNVLWLALGLVICGWESYLGWLESLRNMADGTQFQRAGLNQSWRGMIETLAPHAPPLLRSGAFAILALASLAAVWKLTLDHQRRNTPHSDVLWIGLTLWLIISPYVGHYELLLGLPWWLRIWQSPSGPYPWARRLLLGMYWLTSLISVLGLLTWGGWTLNISAPLLTVWLLGSLIWMNDSTGGASLTRTKKIV